MANSVVQTIRDAEVDARSLSEFIYNPADAMVSRRLAPSIHTLNYYLRFFDTAVSSATADAKKIKEQLLSAQQQAQGMVRYVENTVRDAINREAIEGGEQVDTFVVATPKFDGAIARPQSEINKENTTFRDFWDAKNKDVTDAINKTLKSGHDVVLDSSTENDPFIIGSLDATSVKKISGMGGLNKNDLYSTNIKVKAGTTVFDVSDVRESHNIQVNNMNIWGEKPVSGNFTPGTNFLIDKSGVSTSNQFFHISDSNIKHFDTAISHRNGWGHAFERLRIQWCGTAIETTPSPQLKGWSTSGYTVRDTYIGACAVGINDANAWCATYINTVIEWCGEPYVQNTNGSAAVWINPWWEQNTNPPKWRKGSVVIGGRGTDFSDIDFYDANESITYIDKFGIKIISERDNPDGVVGGYKKDISFEVDGVGVKRLRGSSQLGWDYGKFYSKTNNGEVDDGKYFKFNNAAVVDKNGVATKEGGGGIVGIAAHWEKLVPKDTPIIGMYGQADRWGGYKLGFPKLGVELVGGTDTRGKSGTGQIGVRFATGYVDMYTTGDPATAPLSNYGVRWDIVPEGDFRPFKDAAVCIGSASNRVKEIYASNAVISTSDERLKTEFEDINEAEIACAKELKSQIRKYKFKDAVAEKGDDARIHFGMGAQTVKSIFEKHGLVAEDYALFCKDTWRELDGKVIEEIEEGYEDAKEVYRLGIRYNELSMFILAAI